MAEMDREDAGCRLTAYLPRAEVYDSFIFVIDFLDNDAAKGQKHLCPLSGVL